jgi:hypothetical protein
MRLSPPSLSPLAPWGEGWRIRNTTQRRTRAHSHPPGLPYAASSNTIAPGANRGGVRLDRLLAGRVAPLAGSVAPWSPQRISTTASAWKHRAVGLFRPSPVACRQPVKVLSCPVVLACQTRGGEGLAASRVGTRTRRISRFPMTDDWASASRQNYPRLPVGDHGQASVSGPRQPAAEATLQGGTD